MKVQVRYIGPVAVIALKGSITIGDGDVILRETVAKALEDGYVKVLLDLSEVRYMDSAGIGELVVSHKRAREKHGEVKVILPEGKAADQLRLTRLDEYFDIHKSEAEAIAAFGGRALPTGG